MATTGIFLDRAFEPNSKADPSSIDFLDLPQGDYFAFIMNCFHTLSLYKDLNAPMLIKEFV